MLPIVEDIEIDKDALIKCPIKDFNYRKAAVVCPQCPGYNGIAQMALPPKGPDGEDLSEEEQEILLSHLRWDQKYVIRCGGMIERRTQIIMVVD